jgi:hypothetical protein
MKTWHATSGSKIRIEDFEQGQLVNLRVMFNKKYTKAPGRGIENVSFKDITYKGSHANICIIEGYNETRMIKNIVFENFVINGKLISNTMVKPSYEQLADVARIYVGMFVNWLLYNILLLFL